MKHRIVVLDGHTVNPGDNSWKEIAELGDLTVYDRTPADQIISRAANADIVLTNKTPLTRETLRALPDLRFIAVLATGHNVIDGQAARELGIDVSNVPTYGTASVAQHTIALLLELCHRVGEHDTSIRRGEWAGQPDFCYWNHPLIELEGRTLGIIGYGRIGQKVGAIAHAIGMQILYLKKDSSRTFPHAQGVSLSELAAESDVISLHCALTPSNTGFIDRKFLSQLKPSAMLVNTARGALINEADLADALAEGSIGGAALDVLTQEPPNPNHPLLHAPRCVITPHMAWTSVFARRTLIEVTAKNVRAFLGGHSINVVNPTASNL